MTCCKPSTAQTKPNVTDGEAVRERVRERYGAIAQDVLDRKDTIGCCGPTSCGPDTSVLSAAATDPISRDLYDPDQADELPDAAVAASLGCGNPTALTVLEPGEVVLDLGSGGGIDVLLSARRVSPGGRAIGLDMTDEMLELARRNQAEAGVDNVEFLKGHMEEIPLPDDHVDVVISNCVLNLSTDKPRVFREIFRVLKPGGRVAVSDIVVLGAVDPEIRASAEAWIGCVAGALDATEYKAGLEAAGFTDVEIQPTRTFDLDDAWDLVDAYGINREVASDAARKIVSAFVRATKP